VKGALKFPLLTILRPTDFSCVWGYCAHEGMFLQWFQPKSYVDEAENPPYQGSKTVLKCGPLTVALPAAGLAWPAITSFPLCELLHW